MRRTGCGSSMRRWRWSRKGSASTGGPATAKAVEAAFSRAAHRVGIALLNHRVVINPMEPRGAAGFYDPADGRYTLRLSSQNLHVKPRPCGGVPGRGARAGALHRGGRRRRLRRQEFRLSRACASALGCAPAGLPGALDGDALRDLPDRPSVPGPARRSRACAGWRRALPRAQDSEQSECGGPGSAMLRAASRRGSSSIWPARSIPFRP